MKKTIFTLEKGELDYVVKWHGEIEFSGSLDSCLTYIKNQFENGR
jgi:hypothetical protein